MKRLVKLATAVVAVTVAGSILAADALSGNDQEFLQNAAQLGLTEVGIGKLAQKKGTSPEVKEHGSMMASEHSKGNKELMALAREKGVELKAEPAGAQEQLIADLARKSGAEFDAEYIQHQKQAHRKAIEMFKDAARDAKDPDIKAFAQEQLPHLQSHLAALPSHGGTRTTEFRSGERRLTPGESRQPSRRQKTEGAVRVE